MCAKMYTKIEEDYIIAIVTHEELIVKGNKIS